MPFSDSELILNEDGSIYHLNLKPSDIAKTIIFVGDPDRVSLVSRYFDSIRITKQKREFCTQTGFYKNKEITVMSTGIGTDNIDIVLNELDALINLDLLTKKVKPKISSLDIFRIGTSGSIQKSIPVDSFLISEYGIGMDNVLHFYQHEQIDKRNISAQLLNHLAWNAKKPMPYTISCNRDLLSFFHTKGIYKGITMTNTGFYGPQGRSLRLPLSEKNFIEKISSFSFQDKKITNLEMETSAIYGLAKLLGHRALSINAILANRITGDFSKNPGTTIDRLIRYTLEKIALL